MRTLLLLLAIALFAACGAPNPTPKPVISDSTCTISTVKNLLNWYRKKYDSIDAFQLYNVPPSDDSGFYTINFKETARYLQYLKQSGFFTERFLSDRHAYFQQCDRFLNIHKEHEYGPTGFDTDPLLWSVYTDEFLEDTLNPNIQLTKGRLTFDKYLVFDIKRVGDSCRIDTIRFITDPDSAADAVLAPGAEPTDPFIQEIKRQYDEIQNSKDKFRIVAKDIGDESTEGGDDTLYFESRQLRRASVGLFGETGKIKMDYYFAHGRLFFYIARETRYTKPFAIDNYRIGMIKTTRCYFQNGRLVRWIDEKGKLVDKHLYPEKEKELLVADSSFFSTFIP